MSTQDFHPMPKRFMVWDTVSKKFTKVLEGFWQVAMLADRSPADNRRYAALQSTNLFDKDGKEIFEGSIVNVYENHDFGSGTRLTVGQAIKQKRQNGGRRAWPEMFIAQPRFCENYEGYGTIKKQNGHLEFWCSNCDGEVWIYLGLFLKLKKDGTCLKKKNGEWATEHIAEQAEVLEKLRQRGYCAEFAVGFDEAKKIIDGYLGR